MKITTKKEFMELSSTGRLGNYLKLWNTVAEMDQAGYKGFITIRARDKQNHWFVAVSHTDAVRFHLKEIEDSGGPGEKAFYFQQIPNPESTRIANIEAGTIEHAGFYAHIEPFTTEPVRGIRERVAPLWGPAARLALKQLLSASSLETLDAIWDLFPESIVEASEFSISTGAFNKKLVVWEVRNF